MVNTIRKYRVSLCLLILLLCAAVFVSQSVFQQVKDNGKLYESIKNDTTAKYVGKFTVTQIYDGDTIKVKMKLNGEDEIFSVRFIGCNAPEIRKKDGVLAPWGRPVRRWVEKKIKDNKMKVELYRQGKRNSFERRLYWVVIDLPQGKWVLDELLVEHGFAVVGKKGTEVPEEQWKILNKLEEEAKAAKRGIWGDEKPPEDDTEEKPKEYLPPDNPDAKVWIVPKSKVYHTWEGCPALKRANDHDETTAGEAYNQMNRHECGTCAKH